MKSLHLYLHDEQVARLQAIADRDDRSISYLLRKAVKAFLEDDLNNEWRAAAEHGRDRAAGVAATP